MKHQMLKKTGNEKSGQKRLYTLEVFLLSGPISKSFARRNKIVSRTIQIRGDQTLADLHEAIFNAFDRWDEHMYEFQFGKGPPDPKAKRYVLPMALHRPFGWGRKADGDVTRTTIGSLDLKLEQSFGYWFDFGDDWYHQINVVAISDEIPKGRYPRIIKRVGKSPPQYTNW